MRRGAPLILLLWLSAAAGAPHEPGERRGWGVYLTAASRKQSGKYRLLELNWYGLPENIRDIASVHLFDTDPHKAAYGGGWSPLESYRAIGRDGQKTTSVTFPRFNWTSLTTDTCLGFWAVLSTPESPVASTSCLRARPRWMQDHCRDLGHLRFVDLFIPGTHNSAMYDTHSPDHVSFFDHFLLNQEETILEQLLYGIRSLDLRVQESRGEFWITHDLIKGQVTVREVLQQVRQFVEMTGEPVLLDFHRFTTGFRKRDPNPQENHVRLVQLIREELRDLLLFRNATRVPLADMLDGCRANATGPKVLVCYNHPYHGPGSEITGLGVKHLWANAADLSTLRSFLSEKVCEPTFGTPTSAMVQMTAQLPYFIKSNRKMAQEVNLHSSRWFREDWWRCANLVATDFFLGTDMINVAIEANLRRARGS
ncbi:PI-PLC X domain-containing protein 1-like [Amblyomma americanum]|uniref:Catalytic domain of phosphatidylinositol-specific phospholipase c x domain protein n=1 Tax=Amblyomma americanum TaxID=6943 RepID=A0AAQ4D252_AMBAM